MKNVIFESSEHSPLTLHYLQNYLRKYIPRKAFDVKMFEVFALIYQKMVSFSSLKNWQKILKISF